MRLIGRYRLLVKGDTSKLPSSHGPAVLYLFDRLLSGQEAEMRNLNNLGIEVRQLEDGDEIIYVPPPPVDSP